MEDMTFIKVIANNREFYLFTTIKDEGYDLIITDCQDFWSGFVLKNDSNNRCSDFLPLTRISYQDRSFSYEIDHFSNEKILFRWKEENAAEDLKFILGSATLSKIDDIRCMTQRIFDHCVNMISNINQEVTSVKKDKDMLLQEKADTLKRLDKLVGTKETMEQELYSKFLLVLNSKKTEISTLREKVKDLESKDLKTSEECEEVDSDMETSPSSSIYEQETQIDTEPKPMFSDESSDEEISLTSRQNLETHFKEKKRAKVLTTTTSSSSVSYPSSTATTKRNSLPRKRSLKKTNLENDTMSPTEMIDSDILLDNI
ncbi:DNA repair protein XRCC4 [Octopus bimaculoides]|uniref:XRCC4 coiled-coil domain-containing protein n=1 Tax=Octopus bimaculoides TaxID=37653 RepID=A0A0L8GSM2_OCTBM|nr:DNA repair protein XRCC4 [Octopus bimaculoides]XP_014778690.1 DNA repair protein XRCC4 [Octopus bimaculoides]XP_014778691.1 DNA repair protein XRCC4 [Octopus bimaculoides]XP_014778692.1 DNA repair protein XRCC4 [Octopus bimaculoides]|eukprot:XP_014778689.1 PREDICTED: DNA repair protein XRCC4-like [Octopus bimaculoides]